MKDIFSTRRALRIYGICVMAIALACIALRFFGILFFFDIDIGYYTVGAVPFLASYLPIFAVVLAAVFCFVPWVRVNSNTARNTRSVKISAIFPALGFVFWFVTYAISLIDYNEAYGTIPFVYILTAICALLAAVFFIMTVFTRNTANALYVTAGLFTVIWIVLSLAESYFDIYVQMNSPNKLIFQFATLSGILLTVNEMRNGFDVKRPRFHLFSASIALVLLGTSSIPSVVCFLLGKMPSSYILFYSDCIFLLMLVFAATRLIQLCFAKEEAPIVTGETVANEAEEQTETEADTDETVGE